MAGIQSKTTRNAKKQKSTNHNTEESIKTNLEETVMLELVDNDIKTYIITVFHKKFKKLKTSKY